MFDIFFFAAFPYLAVAIAVGGGIARYRSDRFSYSSQSSQILENRRLFWGSTFWHYGIVLVLTAHVAAFVISGGWADLVANPTRLYVLEAIGVTLGLCAALGLLVLVLRRLGNRRALAVTSRADWLLLAVLLGQVILGLWVAVGYRWGSDWYVHTIAPWLDSLFKLEPNVQYVSVLPTVVQVHAVLGFLLIALFPFTRLVHVVTYPITYLWRPYQVVVWNRRSTPPA